MTKSACEILIPIFNSYDQVRLCVESVLNLTPRTFQIKLLDDASTDLRLIEWMDDIEQTHDHLSIIRSDLNAGFVGNVNRGLEATRCDVILLNSDTIVTSGWIQKMIDCAESQDNIGLVCPLSNNATILSIPEMHQNNGIPGGMSIEKFGNLIESCSGRFYPRLPVAVGFCMLIRNSLIKSIGLLHHAFQKGYGEECDYSMRAWEAGFQVVCCDDTFVYHKGGQSFGSVLGIDAIKKKNEITLLQRWPFYNRLIHRFCVRDALREVRERIIEAITKEQGDLSPTILQVIHSYNALGGTELHSKGIIDGVSENYKTLVIFPELLNDLWADVRCHGDNDYIGVYGYNKENIPKTPVIFGHPASLRSSIVEDWFRRLVAGRGIALVHFQHLLGWGSLELPIIAHTLGTRVVITLHDYYLFCPIYDLLRSDASRCGKNSACADDTECLQCLGAYGWKADSKTPLKDYLANRRKQLIRLFCCSDQIISPSSYVREKFIAAFGHRFDQKIRVIPHGIPYLGNKVCPTPSRTFRLAIFTNLNRRKGAGIVAKCLTQLAKHSAIKIDHFGGIEDAYIEMLKAGKVRSHGIYQLANLSRIVESVDLALVPSIVEETFCLTITELQSLGVPVIAFSIGAIPERIVESETGFLVADESAGALAQRILQISADRTLLRHVRNCLKSLHIKRIEDNAQEYFGMYTSLLEEQNVEATHITTDSVAMVSSDSTTTDYFRTEGLGWRRSTCAYGSSEYRNWIEHIEEGTKSCTPHGSKALLRIDIVVIEGERSLTAMQRTLRSLENLRHGISQLLVVSILDPPSTGVSENLRWTWKRINRKDQIPREVNLWLRKSTGEWVTWINAGDVLDYSFIDISRAYIDNNPDWRFIYTDEDCVAEDGRRYMPLFKPEFNADLLRSTPYIGGSCLLQRATLLGLGGYGSHPIVWAYDLCFNLIDTFGVDTIGHISHILFHRADDNMEDIDESAQHLECKRVISRHLKRNSLPGIVNTIHSPNAFWVDYAIPTGFSISVIILTKGNIISVEQLIEQLSATFKYFDVVIVDFQRRGKSRRITRRREDTIHITTLRAESGWDIPSSLNKAVKITNGECVLVLHDGIRLPTLHGLSNLIGLIARKDVALAGPCILDTHNKILQGYQIAGFWPLGAIGQLHLGETLGNRGYMDRNIAMQNCVTVSGDAFALWKPAFDEMGGFRDKIYPSAWYMLDFGLRLKDLGYNITWTPHSTVIRASEGSLNQYRRKTLQGFKVAEEVAQLYDDWLPKLAFDPTYNVNLSLRTTDYEPETQVGRCWDPVLDSRPKIVGFPDNQWGSGHYRIIDPLVALKNAGEACCAIMPEPKASRVPSAVEMERLSPDTLLLHNAFHDQHLHALGLYRRYGKARLIFSVDDLITDLPSWNPFRKTNYLDIEDRLRTALDICDRLLVSTAALATAYESLTNDIRVVPNRLPAARWAQCSDSVAHLGSRPERPRIGWAGATQHEGDLEWLAPVVEKLSHDADWYFFGMCPNALKSYVTAELPMVDFDHYPSTLAKLQLDVAIAPLALNDFNRCKSNIKVLEYGVLGIPVICTDIEPYRGAPVERLNNDVKSWVDALRARTEARDNAAAEGNKLREWVKKGWMLDDALDDWTNAIF